MTDERRNNERFALASTDFACLLVKGKYELFGTIENLSTGGILLAMFPASPAARPVPGDEVAVLSGPKVLNPLLGELAGRVAWINDDGLGVTFDHPLQADSRELLRRLEETDLLPWLETEGTD
ncbi:PilZ domain-containing protein [Desulfocurvus sp. DL9XJH121]